MATFDRRPIFTWGLLVAAGLLFAHLPTPAAAQTPAVKFQRAQAREKTARATPATKAETLRAVAKAYEAIVRAHPRSGYADNALWQSAGLYILAYERYAARADRQAAQRTVAWLRREYPTSPLAKQASSRLAALEPSKPASAVRSASPNTAASPAAAQPAAEAAPPPPVPSARPPAAAPAPKVSPPAPARTTRPGTEPPADRSGDAPVVAERLPPPAWPEPGTAVRNITYSRLPKGDRITIELNEEAVYATNRTKNPDRLTIDLVNAGIAPGLDARATALSGALFKSVQVSRTVNRATRLVLDVAGQARFSTFPLYNPFRLVVDVETDEALPEAVPAAASIVAKPASRRDTSLLLDEAAAAPSASTSAAPLPRTPALPTAAPPPGAPAATSRGDFSIARQLGLGVARVVIDPGHGGHDPGAQANGVTEAALVLDVAQRVEKLLLDQPGFEVVLTRRTDEFIPLEQRTAIAQRESADMFISIHANASPQSSTRGIETYFLDFASNPQAEAIAARENAASSHAMRQLPELVKAITLNNKLDESRELAKHVQQALVKRLAGPNKAIKDFGVKRAPFVVLIGADMPSVLAEISFITNRSDAALLKQAQHRQRVAQALADAVTSYRNSLKKVGTVAAH